MQMTAAGMPWLAIGVGSLTSIVMYSSLPGPSLGFARPALAFTLPLAAAATHLILRKFWSEMTADRAVDRESEAAHREIANRLVFFIMALHLLVMLNLGGIAWIRSWGPRIVVVLFGSAFIAIGNLLPRTRPNLALGIRTARTLSDRHFWIRFHRTCGYLSVMLGVVIVTAGLLFSGHAIGEVVGAAALTCLAALVVTYREQSRA